MKTSIQQADTIKLTASMLMGFVIIATVFEAMVCFYHIFVVKKCVHPSLKRLFIVVVKRELDELRRRHYIKENSSNSNVNV